MDIEYTLPIHFIIWVVSGLFLTSIFYLWKTEKKKRGYIYAPTVWLVNLITFSTFEYAHVMTPELTALWSGIVRLHGEVLLFILVWLQVKGVKV